jgi:TPR repeat protein
VPQGFEAAARWYEKAANQGHSGSQHNLGLCYSQGTGVAQDYGKAVHWYQKAAKGGLSASQYNLALCYKNGRGTKVDRSEAHAWFRMAADQGDEDAVKKLEALAAVMSRPELDKAEQLYQGSRKSPSRACS